MAEAIFTDGPDDTRPVACADCAWTGQANEVARIKCVEQRLDAGGVVPAGECPECGVLAYLKED